MLMRIIGEMLLKKESYRSVIKYRERKRTEGIMVIRGGEMRR